MELADTYESLTAVPAEHAALYIEKDGKAVLKLDGLKTETDFTNYQTALKARLADAAGDLKAVKNAGMTREEITSAITEAVKTLAPGNGDGRGKGDEKGDDTALALRVHDLERELASTAEKLTVAETAGAASKKTATETQIRNALSVAATKAGVRPAAVDQVVSLIVENFEQSADGNTVTKLEGVTVAGVTPNTAPDGFMAAIKRSSDWAHFWPDSKGSGAGGGSGSGGGGGAGADNPFSADGWNLTKQGTLLQADRPEAERQAKLAGTSIGGPRPKK